MRTTLLNPVDITGIGVHGGQHAQACLRPAESGHGLRINGVHVHLDTVIDAQFATTLQTQTGPVRTVEHLLAALYGLGVDDVEVRIVGGEAPILDGSARIWAAKIQSRYQPGPRWALRPTRRLDVQIGSARAIIFPARRLLLDVETDYPGLGHHTIRVKHVSEVLSARTFGFLADVEPMRRVGLAQGASLVNTVVFDAEGRPLQTLRFLNEVTRHKALDLFGDLALLGAPLLARIHVVRGGHRLHHAVVAAILADHRVVPIPAACLI